MMRKFKFALQPVLGHRERIEDEKQQVFAARSSELQAALEDLARLNGDFKRYSTALRDDHAQLSTDELRWHYAHLEYLDRCIARQHTVIAQCRQAVELARVDLTAASQDRKVMEKLKNKRYEQHRALEAAYEQRELDDANARRRVGNPLGGFA